MSKMSETYHIGPDDDEGLSRQFATEICVECDNPMESCECCLIHNKYECEYCEEHNYE